MKWVWRIGLGILAAVILLVGGGFIYALNAPNRPAKLAQPGPTGRRVVEAGVFGNYFPAIGGHSPHPAILTFGGSEGGLSDEGPEAAALLQKEGFNVLQIAYFNAPGEGSKLESIPLERFYKALDWLKAQSTTDPSRIGIMGYSKGGEAALLVATRYPGIKAAVLGMPSDVVWDALSIRSYLFHGVSSWTENGAEVPSLAYAKPDNPNDMLSRFSNANKKLTSASPLRIPVERYPGQLLMICGGRDTLWPSCPMAHSVIERAAAFRAPRPQLLTYPEAGHGVMGPPLSEQDPRLRRWTRLGGTTHANAAARADGWPKIVAFFDQVLAP